MKTVIHYKCEKCGAVFDTPSAALACEAKDYNLSLDEYNHWMALKKLAQDAGRICGIIKNEKTENEFDVAVNKLLAFEKVHNLS